MSRRRRREQTKGKPLNDKYKDEDLREKGGNNCAKFHPRV